MSKDYLLSMLLALVCFSCDEDEEIARSLFERGGGFFVVNEGAFQQGNGSFGFFNALSGEYEDAVFASQNDLPLGDVVQSALNIDDRIYIVVNNSNKIEILEADSLKSTGRIEGLNSPRYMTQVLSLIHI